MLIRVVSVRTRIGPIGDYFQSLARFSGSNRSTTILVISQIAPLFVYNVTTRI